ncbi:hypothetical protein [Streptomyces parvulus]|uniref:hypothetical protein n=1 Tax=Streptomyces parvulus TaxID=146923 RepID=UPI0037FF004E
MNPYSITARRLRIAATVFEAHARHRSPAVLDIVTRGFLSAAGACEDTAPGGPATMPEELEDARAALVAVFVAHDFQLSAALVGYAFAPLAGELPDLTDHRAVGEGLARQDLDLRARRNKMLRGAYLDSADDEIVRWALRSLATIHYVHERLEAEIAADNARPCNAGKLAWLPSPRQTGERGTR